MLPVVDHTDKNEVVASIIIEQAMEPVKPKIIHVEDTPNLFFARFEACLQDFDVFNRNKRRYLFKPMVESWNAPHVKELIQRGDMFGECGHPITKDPVRVVSIDPKLACHRIIDYRFQGKSLYGTIETLNDDMYGKQFTKHILQGCTAAFSLRALAPLTKIDATRCEIRSKCHIVTEDRVILPSHNKAYATNGPTQLVTSSIVNESTSFEALINSMGNTSEVDVNISYPVTESAEFTNYLLEESHNIKEIIDHFEVNYESAYLSKDKKTMLLTEKADALGSKQTFAVSLENYLNDEVSAMLRKW
jgi:hypothetical protein